MFSRLIILDSRLSFIVTENCPEAMTGGAKTFEASDGYEARLGEGPRR